MMLTNKIDPKIGFRLLNDYPDIDRDTDATIGYLMSDGTDFEVLANRTILNYQNFNLIIFSREHKARLGMKRIVDTLMDDLQLKDPQTGEATVDYIEFTSYAYFPKVELNKNLELTQLLFTTRSIT